MFTRNRKVYQQQGSETTGAQGAQGGAPDPAIEKTRVDAELKAKEEAEYARIDAEEKAKKEAEAKAEADAKVEAEKKAQEDARQRSAAAAEAATLARQNAEKKMREAQDAERDAENKRKSEAAGQIAAQDAAAKAALEDSPLVTVDSPVEVNILLSHGVKVTIPKGVSQIRELLASHWHAKALGVKLIDLAAIARLRAEEARKAFEVADAAAKAAAEAAKKK